ncbi:MAG: hypothetical protein ACP5OG_02615 [Candidatus Nanoarchaeia archaeon]
MSKKDIIDELTTILAISLRHKIGSIVNENELYAQRYSKDAEALLNAAKKSSQKSNWSNYDKQEISKITKEKLIKELEKRDFLNNKKFDLVDDEIYGALRALNLN